MVPQPLNFDSDDEVEGNTRSISGHGTPITVVIVGDTVVSEQGLVTLVRRNPSYEVHGAAHTFQEANQLIAQHRPDILLIEPFIPNCDGLRWIRDLAERFPDTRILVVSSQAEQTYAERTLRAGASGYWMKNGSAEELMRSIATVANGDIYVSPLMAALAVKKLARRRTNVPAHLEILSDRELAVFSLIAAGHGVGRIAGELGISRKTVETHCEHIKVKLGYADAAALRRGAAKLLGTSGYSFPNS